MRKTKIIKLLSAVMIITVAGMAMTACGKDKKTSSSNDGKDKIVISIGHTDSSNRSTNKAGEWLGKYLSDKTDGRITVEMYPDGAAGDDPQLVEGVKLGTVTMWYGLSSVLAATTGDASSCIDLPYLYDNYDAWVEGTFKNGGLELFNETLRGSGYVCLDMMYNGMRNVISNKKVYHNSGDLKGEKIRIAQNDLNVKIWQAMGAQPTPMAWGEVITSLSNKVITGLDHSIGVFNDFKLYEMAPYVTLTNHCSSPYTLVCSEQWLNSLSKEDRELIVDGIHKMCEKQREEERQNELQYLKDFEKAGATVYEPTEDEINAFKKSVKPIYDEWEKKVGKDTLDKWLKTVPKK